jgi:hypothetical protein
VKNEDRRTFSISMGEKISIFTRTFSIRLKQRAIIYRRRVIKPLENIFSSIAGKRLNFRFFGGIRGKRAVFKVTDSLPKVLAGQKKACKAASNPVK